MKTSDQRFVLFICVCLIGLMIEGCGEDYSKQGGLLYEKIYEHLISRRICPTVDACKAELEIHGRYKNQINLTVHSLENRKTALGAFTEFVVEHGIEITGGVPIGVSINVRSSEESGYRLFGGKTFIEMEIVQ